MFELPILVMNGCILDVIDVDGLALSRPPGSVLQEVLNILNGRELIRPPINSYSFVLELKQLESETLRSCISSSPLS